MAEDLQPISAPESGERKNYSAPAIAHELKLETRAGSPLRPGMADPLGIDPTNPQGD